MNKKVLFLMIFYSLSFAEAFVGYSVGGSSGSMVTDSGVSKKYTEANISLTYWYQESLGIEITGLARFVDDDKKHYGAQLGFPMILEFGPNFLGTRVGLTPGYRVLEKFHAPVMDGRLSFQVGGSRLGMGYRIIFNDLVKNGLEDEAQLYFNFSASVF